MVAWDLERKRHYLFRGAAAYAIEMTNKNTIDPIWGFHQPVICTKFVRRHLGKRPKQIRLTVKEWTPIKRQGWHEAELKEIMPEWYEVKINITQHEIFSELAEGILMVTSPKQLKFLYKIEALS